MTKKINLILIIAIIVLVIINIGTVYFLYLKQNNKIDNKKQEVNIIPENNISNENEILADKKLSTSTSEKNIVVAWNEWPITTIFGQLFPYAQIEEVVKNFNSKKENIGSQIDKDVFEDSVKIYKVGVIAQGDYLGGELFILKCISGQEGMYKEQMFRVIKTKDDRLVLLSKYSQEPLDILKELCIIDDKTVISDLEKLPVNISILNSKIKLIKNLKEPFLLINDYQEPKKLFEYSKNEFVYKDKESNCFFIKAPDGTAKEYYLDLDFIGLAGNSEGSNNKSMFAYGGIIPNMLDFIWLDDSKNSNEYTFQKTGMCGSFGCYNYADYITDISQLEKVGQTANNNAIYELKDKNFTIKNAENSILKEIYNNYYPGYDEVKKQEKTKISFEEFVKEHPLIYWQDPFGEFIEFKNAKYLPAVECS
ncbi:hypothetical protein CVV26_00410 [Candidatus Kuenenbacteria bacterium HGW-Kuenenbacteria-1]|uniref:Uncharacterized protein n=1 Tax=Candidatus Kuenenbacteria bacterium HGW-Kuenenbacteria-1 TaxID=2013812 RepID=A0A2N1UP88_9BACT|nr:MAG: hypothetical protein CVV26_00410 [Candidatus Kuenenbacteria bacterium HGW-Kuenenbacteria-1]